MDHMLPEGPDPLHHLGTRVSQKSLKMKEPYPIHYRPPNLPQNGLCLPGLFFNAE